MGIKIRKKEKYQKLKYVILLILFFSFYLEMSFGQDATVLYPCENYSEGDSATDQACWQYMDEHDMHPSTKAPVEFGKNSESDNSFNERSGLEMSNLSAQDPADNNKPKEGNYVDQRLMKEWKKYFSTFHVGARKHYFYSDKYASQALKDECSKQYDSFKNVLNEAMDIEGQSSDPKKVNHFDAKVNRLEFLSKQCLSAIIEEHIKIYERYSKLNRIIVNFDLEQFRSSNFSRYDDANLNKLKNAVVDFHRGLGNGSFRQQCIIEPWKATTDRFASTLGKLRFKKNNLDASKIGEILEKLHRNNCNDRAEVLQNVIDNGLLTEFEGTPESCGFNSNNPYPNSNTDHNANDERGSCVERLKKSVGINLVGNEISLFSECGKYYSITESCCLDPDIDECEHTSNKQEQAYQSILGSEEKTKKICLTDKDEREDALENFFSQKKNICNESVGICQKTCRSKLEGFKEKFKQCFFLPKIDNHSYGLYPEGTACRKDINVIKREFNNAMQDFPKMNGNFITLEDLESIDENNNSYINRSIEERCNEPKKNLNEKSHKEREELLDDILEDECEKRLAKNDDSDNASDSSGTNPQDYYNQNYGYSSTGGGYQQGGPGGYGNTSGLNTPNGNLGGESTRSGNLDREYMLPTAGAGRRPAGANGKTTDGGTGSKSSDTDKYADNYTGPKDPLNAFFSRTVKSSDLDGSSDDESSLDEDSKNSKFSSQAGVRRSVASSFVSSSFKASYTALKDYPSNLGKRISNAIKKPLQAGYKAMFSDPAKTVASMFNIHGSKVNLMDRQRSLAKEFCSTHKCD